MWKGSFAVPKLVIVDLVVANKKFLDYNTIQAYPCLIN